MEDKKNERADSAQNVGGPREGTSANENRDNIAKAHDEAEKDINNDAELSAHSPNDDLDEGETARLGEGDNPLV